MKSKIIDFTFNFNLDISELNTKIPIKVNYLNYYNIFMQIILL